MVNEASEIGVTRREVEPCRDGHDLLTSEAFVRVLDAFNDHRKREGKNPVRSHQVKRDLKLAWELEAFFREQTGIHHRTAGVLAMKVNALIRDALRIIEEGQS